MHAALRARKQSIRNAEAAGAPRMLEARRALNRALRAGNREGAALPQDSYAIDMLDDILFETNWYTFSTYASVVDQVVERCNELLAEGNEVVQVALHTAGVALDTTHSVIYYRRARPPLGGRIAAMTMEMGAFESHEKGARWVQSAMRRMTGASMIGVCYDGQPQTPNVTLFVYAEA